MLASARILQRGNESRNTAIPSSETAVILSDSFSRRGANHMWYCAVRDTGRTIKVQYSQVIVTNKMYEPCIGDFSLVGCEFPQPFAGHQLNKTAVSDWYAAPFKVHNDEAVVILKCRAVSSPDTVNCLLMWSTRNWLNCKPHVMAACERDRC